MLACILSQLVGRGRFQVFPPCWVTAGNSFAPSHTLYLSLGHGCGRVALNFALQSQLDRTPSFPISALPHFQPLSLRHTVRSTHLPPSLPSHPLPTQLRVTMCMR